MTLDESITSAITTEKVEEPKVEAPVVEEEKKEETPKLSDADRAQADEIYLALKNPEQAPRLLAALAAGAGLSLSGTETKAEVKEIKEELKETLEDQIKRILGSEHDFLSPAFAKVQTLIDKRINDLVDEKIKDVKETVSRNEIKEQEAVVNSALANVIKELAIDEKTQGLMLKEMEDLPPSPNSNPDTYFRKIYKIVAPEKVAAAKVTSNTKPAPDPLSHLGSAGTPEHSSAKSMSLDDAVRGALQAISK